MAGLEKSLAKQVKKGQWLLVTGDVKRYRFSKELVHPETELRELHQIGVPGGLVQVEVDRDHEIELVERVNELFFTQALTAPASRYESRLQEIGPE